MSAPDKSRPSRIAIKFAGSSSGSAKKAAGSLPSSSLGKRPRHRNGLGGDSESESDDEHTSGQHERITAFGSDGAVLAKSSRDAEADRRRPARKVLAIERQPNRDWRSEARARHRGGDRQPARDSIRQEFGSQTPAKAADVPKEEQPMKWGISITKAAPADDKDDSRDDDTASSRADTPSDGGDAAAKSPKGNEADDAEKEAVMALLGKETEAKKRSRFVIERAANVVTEDDVFSRDFHDAPNASTLDEYEAMPVEEFGAALLRGMGWDGKDRGPKIKQVVRRPNQMGLGAKELKGAEDLGSWNHKPGSSGGHKQRPPRLHEYRREEDKRREKREERYRDSYKGEQDREREREREDRRSGGHHHHSSSSSRHRSRHNG